jgi:hypothetical protein
MAEDSSQPPSLRHEPQLTPVGEKSLPARCKTNTLKYCPTMDLISLVTEDDELRVFRLNGQRAFGGSFKGDPYLDEDDGGGEIRKLMWKNNGTSLRFCGLNIPLSLAVTCMTFYKNVKLTYSQVTFLLSLARTTLSVSSVLTAVKLSIIILHIRHSAMPTDLLVLHV